MDEYLSKYDKFKDVLKFNPDEEIKQFIGEDAHVDVIEVRDLIRKYKKLENELTGTIPK